MKSKITLWLKENFGYSYLRLTRWVISDRQFIKNRYRKIFGREIHFEDPKSFNEKIQFLKLHYHPQNLPTLADKFEVRKYIEEKKLGWTLNDLLAVYNQPEEIDFAALPDSFVLKMTHGSGWNIICPDKAKMNWGVELKKVKRWSKQNYYDWGREWIYKDIRPRILIEKYLSDGENESLPDYKFFCFHGAPLFIQVDVDRHTDHKRNLYDLDWQLLPCRYVFPLFEREIPKPSNLEEMVSVSKVLSQDFVFSRIDLFSVAGRTVFGEMTFTPENGFGRFYPQEYDAFWGSKIVLENCVELLGG